MSRLKIPSREEIVQLAQIRSDACVSIYVETSPLGLHADQCRIELGNLSRQALDTLKNSGFNKRRLAALTDLLEFATGAEEFCLFQANSLAVLATPDNVRIYRLANHLQNQIEVSDRFYIKPLLRAITFPHVAYILALSENEAKVIELFPDVDPEVIKVPGMPKNARDALGRRSMTAGLTKSSPGDGASGRKKRLAEYCHIVDEALRPLLRACGTPLILMAAEPMASIYRSVATTCILEQTIPGSPDKVPDHDLITKARPLLDAYYAQEVKKVRDLFDQSVGQRRAVTDMADAAQAATQGMIRIALVDFDYTETGTVGETGQLSFGTGPGTYGLIDEIVKRALESGADILAVRKEDMIGDSGIAAILRYPLPDAGQPDLQSNV